MVGCQSGCQPKADPPLAEMATKLKLWKSGRVVEGTALEKPQGRNVLVSSNLTSSAFGLPKL